MHDRTMDTAGSDTGLLFWERTAMRRSGKAAAFAVLLLLIGSIVEAQHPRCRTRGCRPSATASTGALTYMGTMEMRNAMMYGSFSRTVTVDSGGAGDYTDLSDALDFVAAQSGRGQFSRWLVLLYPGLVAASGGGQYDEALTAVPSYTTLKGIVGPWGNGSAIMGMPIVHPTSTTGTLVTLGQNASVENIMFHVNNLTGTTVAVEVLGVSGNPVNLTNVAIYASGGLADHSLDMLKVTSGSVVAHNLQVSRTGANTATRGVVISSGVTSATLYGGQINPGSGSLAGIENLSASGVTIVGTRLGPSVAQLKKSSSGAITAQGVSYTTFSGAITHNPVLDETGTAFPAACAPGASFVDTTTGAPRQCFCSASNTWTCNTGASASATAPYACDAGHAGAVYVDTTTPSLCFCSGSAWITTVAAGDCT